MTRTRRSLDPLLGGVKIKGNCIEPGVTGKRGLNTGRSRESASRPLMGILGRQQIPPGEVSPKLSPGTASNDLIVFPTIREESRCGECLGKGGRRSPTIRKKERERGKKVLLPKSYIYFPLFDSRGSHQLKKGLKWSHWEQVLAARLQSEKGRRSGMRVFASKIQAS